MSDPTGSTGRDRAQTGPDEGVPPDGVPAREPLTGEETAEPRDDEVAAVHRPDADEETTTDEADDDGADDDDEAEAIEATAVAGPGKDAGADKTNALPAASPAFSGKTTSPKADTVGRGRRPSVKGRDAIDPARTAGGLASEQLPYIDDRATKIWVVAIVATFVVIFLYAALLGTGGFLTPISSPTPEPTLEPTPSASPSPSPSSSPSASPGTSSSPSASAGASASSSPSASAGVSGSGSPSPSASPTPALSSASPSASSSTVAPTAPPS